MNGYKIFPTFLAVFIILVPIVIAPPSGETSIDITTGGTGGGIGATTSLKANGASCSAASECTGGFCNSGVCASSAPSAGVSGAGGGAAEVTPSAAPKEEAKPAPKEEAKPAPTQITSVSVPVTETTAVQEIITAIKPSDLGVSEIKVENVQVTKTGIAQIITTTQAPILQKTVEDVLPTVTDVAAQQVLNEIKQAVSSGASFPVSVSTTIEVFEVKEKTTNKTAFASKITLTLKPVKDLTDVNIVEVIPKSLASNIAQVIFLGEQPKVLQADPIVQWTFPVVEQGETKYLSYQVAKKIETIETKTIAAGQFVVEEAPEAPETPPAKIPTYVWITFGVIVIVAVVYFLYQRKTFKF